MNRLARIGSGSGGIGWKCLSLAVLLFLPSWGAAAELIPLRAGPVSMAFDPDTILLRYIKVGEHEMLRAISAPVRDQNWATVGPKLSNLKVVNQTDHFELTFDVRCKEADIDFRWKGSITGSNQGVIEYAFDGEADSAFKRNRIGFCILHGPSAAGKPWVIETADGKSSEGQFPSLISPNQPAKNLKAITHEVAPGLRARVEMEGDIFEMEDQRNWTDASFKTYCTPLSIPYPVELAKGTKVTQKIRISLVGKPDDPKPATNAGTVLTLTSRESDLPKLGLQISGEVSDLTDLQIKRLKALNLDHLRVDLVLSDPSFVAQLRRATEQARELGVSLQVGLNFGAAPDFAALLKEVQNLKPPVSWWLVIGVDGAQLKRTAKELTSVGEGKIGMTENTNFVELNRGRPDTKVAHAIGFAINPQVHSFDNLSMIETVSMHAVTVNSARAFAAERPLVIGPITLRPQLINGKVQPGGPPPGRFPIYLDERQGTPFAAAWTLGSLKFLSDSGAHSATYFETVGWNGIMDADDVKSRPAGWPSKSGELFPTYHLLSALGEFTGAKSRILDSSDPLAAAGILLKKGNKTLLLVGNLTNKPQSITLAGFSGKSTAVNLLGDNHLEVVQEGPITLPPYAIARVGRTID